MKKLLALLMVMAFMFGMPAMTQADLASDAKTGTEDVGHDFFMYLGKLVEYPVHILEQGVRTLLFMDKE